MTIQEFSSLKKKELNVTYSVDVDGVTKVVELTDSKREEKKVGSKNQKTLYLAKVDGVSYEDYFNITDLCKKIAGKNVAPRQISENAAKKRNLQPLANYKSANAFDNCLASARRFSELERELKELQKKYHFASETAPLANAALSLPHYKKYTLRIAHIKEVCTRYQAMRTNYIETLQRRFDNAKSVQKEWLSNNWQELTKKQGQQKANELQDIVDNERYELEFAQSKVYLTDKDIYKRYGIEL